MPLRPAKLNPAVGMLHGNAIGILVILNREIQILVRTFRRHRRLAQYRPAVEFLSPFRILLNFRIPILGGIQGFLVIVLVGNDAEFQAADTGDEFLHLLNLFAREQPASAAGLVVFLDKLVDFLQRFVWILLADAI